MASCSVIVNGDDRIFVHLCQTSNGVVVSLLHLSVCSLNCIEFYLVAVLSCVNGTYSTSAHTNTVVVSAKQHNLVSALRSLLCCINLLGVSNSAGQHNHFIISELWILFLHTLLFFSVFKGEERTAYNGLTKLVSKVTCSV